MFDYPLVLVIVAIYICMCNARQRKIIPGQVEMSVTLPTLLITVVRSLFNEGRTHRVFVTKNIDHLNYCTTFT